MLRQPGPLQSTLRSALSGALVGMGIVFLFVLFQATQVYDLVDTRAMDQAQLARNLSRGEGFTTKLLRPLSLARSPQVSRHPDLINPPLHPLLTSLVFRVAGPSARAATWASGIPFLLTIPLVLWLGTHAFSRKVGVLAALATAGNLGLLTVASIATDVALLGFLFTLLAIVLVLLHEKEAQRPNLAAAAGALSGLLYLTDYTYLVVLLPVVALVAATVARRQRIVTVALCLLLFIAVCSPWWIRNLLITGNPFFTLRAHETVMATRTHSGNTLYRTFRDRPMGLAAFAFHNPREVYEKVHDTAVVLTPALFTVAGVVITPFFLVAIMIPLDHVGLDRLRLMLYGAMALLAGASLFLFPDRTLVLPLTPVITVVAAAFFYRLLDLRLRPCTEATKARWTSLAVTLLLGCHVLPVVLQLAPGRATAGAGVATLIKACGELNNLTSQLSGGAKPVDQDPVYTDVPWAIAWFSDRPAVWLPTTMVDVRRVEQAVGKIEWLALTPQILDIQGPEKAEWWADIWRDGRLSSLPSPDWRVRQRFASGGWLLLERVADAASVGSVTVGGADPPTGGAR